MAEVQTQGARRHDVAVPSPNAGRDQLKSLRRARVTAGGLVHGPGKCRTFVDRPPSKNGAGDQVFAQYHRSQNDGLRKVASRLSGLKLRLRRARRPGPPLRPARGPPVAVAARQSHRRSSQEVTPPNSGVTTELESSASAAESTRTWRCAPFSDRTSGGRSPPGRSRITGVCGRRRTSRPAAATAARLVVALIITLPFGAEQAGDQGVGVGQSRGLRLGTARSSGGQTHSAGAAPRNSRRPAGMYSSDQTPSGSVPRKRSLAGVVTAGREPSPEVRSPVTVSRHCSLPLRISHDFAHRITHSPGAARGL